MRPNFPIGAKQLGDPNPCFVIAEAGVNHNGDPALARKLVDIAHASGADAVKFQTFEPARLASANAPKAAYQDRNDARHGDQRSMLEALVLSRDAHYALKRHAATVGIVFMSSPFDESSADFLEELGVDAFKIPSGEITNHPFLAHVARKKRPMLVSTGMATLGEVASAVDEIRANGNPPLALFHCVSNYPASPGDCNLRAMATMRARFGVPVGWSDHTLGRDVTVAAAALGAEIVEKHFTTDRNLPGPDHLASLEPDELTKMVAGIRAAEASLGSGEKKPTEAELAVAQVVRKSLHWATSLAAGTRLETSHFVALRPAGGVSPANLRDLIGRRIGRVVCEGARVNPEDFEEQA